MFSWREYTKSTITGDFHIHQVNGDNEYFPVRDEGYNINITSRNKHVPRIERKIRVIKERGSSSGEKYNSRSSPNK